jgi:hypothetical protein
VVEDNHVKNTQGRITVNNIIEYKDVENIADAFVKSGLFSDTKEKASAVVKILAGQEIGIGPFAAMSGINIILGKLTVSAGIMAAAVKRSAKYNYVIRSLTDQLCELEFFEDGVSVGTSSFTIEDARKAGTKNIEKYPRNMLFARAISNGIRWFAPDVFSSTVYTPGELDKDSVVIDQSTHIAEGSLDFSETIVAKISEMIGKKPDEVKVVLRMSSLLNGSEDEQEIIVWINDYVQSRKDGVDPYAAASNADSLIKAIRSGTTLPQAIEAQQARLV